MSIARPLLPVSKADLYAYCDDNNVPYIEDPSNENIEYLRPRLRKSMEVLAAEGLTPKRLATTAFRISRAEQALEEITDQAFQKSLETKDDECITFDISSLRKYPDEIVFRILSRAFKYLRDDKIYDVRMEKMEDLFQSLWYDMMNFKPRTLGGCIVSIYNESLLIKLE